MDKLLTTGKLARGLGTTVPRVMRAVRAGIIVPVGRTPGGHLRFDARAVETLRRHWGSVARVADLSASEMRVLAALARRSFGLRTARGVARAAGVSPTTAARTLDALRRRDLVARRQRVIAEGRVKTVETWMIQWRSPVWWQIAPAIHRVILPESAHPRTRIPRGLPKRFWHLFWDVNPASTDLRRHADFVVTRVLESGDPRAVAWLVTTFPRAALRAVAVRPGRIKPEVRRLAMALAGGPDERIGHPTNTNAEGMATARDHRPARGLPDGRHRARGASAAS